MPSYPAILKINPIKKNNLFKDQGIKLNIKSIKVKHGKVECRAFIINDKCAYLSDVSMIYKKDYKHFKNLKYFSKINLTLLKASPSLKPIRASCFLNDCLSLTSTHFLRMPL